MFFVVDSNIIFSAIIAPQGKTRDLLFCKQLTLCAPQTLIEEIYAHKNEILEKTRFTENELELILISTISLIEFVPLNELANYINEADTICPDKDDMAFFAVCLAKSLPLWSNDRKLKNQNRVKVYNTEEIMRLLD